MPYSDFEADGIEYRLILSRHYSSPKCEPIEDLDAIVKESGMMDKNIYAYCLANESEIYKYKDTLIKNEIPIYTVDPEFTTRSILAALCSFLPHAFLYPAATYLTLNQLDASPEATFFSSAGLFAAQIAAIGVPAFSNGILGKAFAKLNSCFSFLRQAPIEELRNAVCARKIKKGVLPHLMNKYPERFENRNPRIGVIYGGTHSSIERCLKNNRRTAFTLNLHRLYGIPVWLKKDSLKEIYVHDVTPKGTKFEKFDCDLF